MGASGLPVQPWGADVYSLPADEDWDVVMDRTPVTRARRTSPAVLEQISVSGEPHPEQRDDEERGERIKSCGKADHHEGEEQDSGAQRTIPRAARMTGVIGRPSLSVPRAPAQERAGSPCWKPG
jgi:hypothetical protein